MPDEKPNFGPSVVRGGTPSALLRSTSVSAIQTADAGGTEGGCLRKFYYEKVLGMKPPSKVSQDKGKAVHAQLEHYLTTFPPENVLGSIAILGQPFLPVPGPDLRVEQALAPEEDTRAAIALREAGGDPDEISRLAGLDAAGVPLVGYIDVWHTRGEYVDGNGVLHKEIVRTAEAVDHKTSSDVERWSKTAEQLSKTVQMIGYGEFLRRRLPLDAVRLSHINYPTKGKFASKVTTLVEVNKIVKSWARVEDVVREMEQVAKLSSVDKVPANTDACGSFGGCGHKSYCSRPERTVAQLLGIKKKRSFDMDKSFGNGVPSLPTGVPSLSDEARYAAEYARLTSSSSVLPFDAPIPDSIASADPLSQEVVDRIADTELRAMAEAHRLASAQVAPPPRASVAPKSGKTRCPGGAQRVALTPKDAKAKQKACSVCGSVQKLKNFSDDCDTAEIAGHMVSAAPAVPVVAAPAVPVVAAPAVPVVAAPAVPVAPVVAVPTALYIDVSFDKGVEPQKLDAWFDDIVFTVQQGYGVADIREATGNHPLAFGRWKAVLTLTVRENPVLPGEYQFRVGGNEIRQVVAEALESMFQRVVRGTR